MGQIFNPDNLVFRGISRLVDIVGLSLLWAVMCIPLITIVPVTAALYHALYRVFRKKDEDRAFWLFFRSFRENWKQGIPLSLMCLAVAWVLYLMYQWLFYIALLDSEGVVVFVFFYVLMVLPIGALCWLCPLLGRFCFSTRELLKTSVQMVFAHLPSTVILVLLTAELVSIVPEYHWVPLLAAPGVWVLVSSLFLERAFAKHLPERTPQIPEDET